MWQEIKIGAIAFSSALVLSMNATAASAKVKDDNTILWAGCGITKKAFMAELAQAYEAKTGIKVELQGGVVGQPYAEMIREGEINSIHIFYAQ